MIEPQEATDEKVSTEEPIILAQVKFCCIDEMRSLSINMTIPAKYIFVNTLRGSRHLSSNTPIHWIAWFSCTFEVTVIAYIIASAIPVFDSLVSLVCSMLDTLTYFQAMGCMWLSDNWHKGKKTPYLWHWLFKVCLSIFVIALGCFLTVAGTYGSVVGIMVSYRESGVSAAFSCADNSNPV